MAWPTCYGYLSVSMLAIVVTCFSGNVAFSCFVFPTSNHLLLGGKECANGFCNESKIALAERKQNRKTRANESCSSSLYDSCSKVWFYLFFGLPLGYWHRGDIRSPVRDFNYGRLGPVRQYEWQLKQKVNKEKVPLNLSVSGHYSWARAKCMAFSRLIINVH